MEDSSCDDSLQKDSPSSTRALAQTPLKEAYAVLALYCTGEQPADILAAKEACDIIQAHILTRMKEAGIMIAPSSLQTGLDTRYAKVQHGDCGSGTDSAGLQNGHHYENKRRRADDDNPHRFKVVSVRACLVCGGPRGTDDGSDGHCQSCYTALWRDAKRVVERGVKQKRSIALTGDRRLDLELFTREAASVGKACNTYNCGPEKYHHSLSEQSRCTRCRTKAAIRLLPELSHRLLEKSCAALLKDTQRKAALYGMLHSPAVDRSRADSGAESIRSEPVDTPRVTSAAHMHAGLGSAVTHAPVHSTASQPVTTAVSFPGFPSSSPPGPMQLMFNPYTGQYMHPFQAQGVNNPYFLPYPSPSAFGGALLAGQMNPLLGTSASGATDFAKAAAVSKAELDSALEVMREALAHSPVKTA
eukprot:m.226956 g.226956  ORF g.226956 m.226956 type:complete len:416 (-) comp11508_c0_seq1:387-1634(-)